jgi:hypothetical protein
MSEQFKGIYGKIEFPPYKFAEYPKMVTLADGVTQRIVANQREELALIAELGPDGMHQDPVVEAKIKAENEAGTLRAQLQKRDEEFAELKAKLDALSAAKVEPKPAVVK